VLDGEAALGALRIVGPTDFLSVLEARPGAAQG